MPKDNVFRINASGGQVNIAKGNATINATQNIVEIAREELAKSKPKVGRLRNCLTLIAPMFTIANGIPTLSTNLQRLQEYISSYIH